MKKKPAKRIEWIGGLASMPGYVTGEGAPYRPEVLFWLGAEGAVLGHLAGRPGELVRQVAASLQRAIERPMFGPPHAPARVRVASSELAEALRAAHPTIEIVVAPTPEVDEVMAAMREQIAESEQVELSYLSSGIDPERIGALFRAAAGLFRAKPWQRIPGDVFLFLTIEKLGVRDVVVSVMGQMGENLGLLLFASPEDLDAFLAAGQAQARGEEPKFPPHFALSFERGADLDPVLRREILQHGWEVAGADSYPWLASVDEDLVTRPMTAEEISILEALALALPALLGDDQALPALQGGETLERTVAVAAHAGALDVALRVPHPRDAAGDLMVELLALGHDGDEIDAETRRELEDELVHRFSQAPEGKSVPDTGVCHFVMDFAAEYFGATIATLGPAQLREIVFEIIPRKVSVDATAAGGIIDELHAFYTFLAREFALAQAAACLRVLAGDAVRRLAAALADASKFGLAKSILMGGQNAGFDMTTREGVEAWMRTLESQPLPPSVRLPTPGPQRRPDKPVDARAKKTQRKAERKARKKQR